MKIEDMENKIVALQEELKDCKLHITTLQSGIDERNVQINDLMVERNILREKNQDLEGKIHALGGMLQGLRTVATQAIDVLYRGE